MRGLCARFGGEYWRGLDVERGYPVEFVEAMTRVGFHVAPNPEENVWGKPELKGEKRDDKTVDSNNRTRRGRLRCSLPGA